VIDANLNIVTAIAFLFGAIIAVVAGVGLIRFPTTYARMHAAGKASPVSFLVIAIGAGIELGWAGTAKLAVAAAAIVFTLPVGVHLLFRAVHRSSSNSHLVRDDLAPVPGGDSAPDGQKSP
jgi:multicomponent Na+:H+ antiporter subunit G